MVTMGSIFLVSLNPVVKDWVFANPAMLWVAMILSLALVITFSCLNLQKEGSNIHYVILGLFTLCECYLLAFISATYQTASVVQAIVITAAIVISLTLYVMTSDRDFSGMGSALFCCLMVSLPFLSDSLYLCVYGCVSLFPIFFLAVLSSLLFV